MWCVPSIAMFGLLLAACGESPPPDRARAAIEAKVRGFDGDLKCAVVEPVVASWQQDESFGPHMHQTTWSAKLRLDEPVGAILDTAGGVNVLQVIGKSGDTLPFNGGLSGQRLGDQWQVEAHIEHSGLTDLLESAQGLRANYVPGPGSDGSATLRMNRVRVVALSKAGEYVEAGSDAERKLHERLVAQRIAEAEARQARIAAQQAAAEEQRQAQQAAREEQQRRAQAEQAERVRLAQEEAQRRADAALDARLTPLLEPFRGEHGALLAAPRAEARGTLLVEVQLDEKTRKVVGRGYDLSALPVREISFEAVAEDRGGRGSLAWRVAAEGEPERFWLGRNAVVTGPGNATIVPLTAEQRASFDVLAGHLRRLGAAEPLELVVETLGAEDCKARETGMEIAGLTGAAQVGNRAFPDGHPIFGDALVGKRPLALARDAVTLRLETPVTGRGLFIKGSTTACDNLLVTINGVHRARIAQLEREGGAIIAFPPGLELLDLRLEVVGRLATRGIVLLR